jgi:hypothetical protein
MEPGEDVQVIVPDVLVPAGPLCWRVEMPGQSNALRIAAARSRVARKKSTPRSSGMSSTFS